MNNKGCVYFFKHYNIDAVKIGYSSNESPLQRFECFKTYAPYGAELIGFIESEEAKKIETDLHKKFSAYRLQGEWFDISIETVKKQIELYNSIQICNKRNEFEIAYSRMLEQNKINEIILINKYLNKGNRLFLSNTEIVEYLKSKSELKFSKQNLTINMKKLGFVQEVKRVDGKTKRGFYVELKTIK